MSTQDQKFDKDEISLKETIIGIKIWIRYFISKWKIIVAFGLTGGLLGFIYASQLKILYTASTTFVLEDEKGGGGLGSLMGLASMAGVDLGSGGGGIFQGDNILELYKSRSMIEKTLLSPIENDTSKLMIDLYISAYDLRKSWENDPKLKGITFRMSDLGKSNSRVKDSLLGRFAQIINENVLKVSKPDKKTTIIRVDVKAHNEIFAKVFNNKIVDKVNEFYKQTRTKKSLDNVAIIQRKTDSVRAVMNNAIFSIASIGDATQNLNPARLVQRVAPMQRSQFSAETNRAVLGELVKNLEMSRLALLKETPLIQIVDTPTYPLKKEKLGKAKAIILGGIIFGILSLILIVSRKVYIKIINE